MFVILWEFEVKPGSEPAFESAYSAQGDWVQLFRRDPHYRTTYLLKDTSRPRIYFTMDLWDSQHDYENFKNAHHDAYLALDQVTGELTLRERLIGAFLQGNSATLSL